MLQRLSSVALAFVLAGSLAPGQDFGTRLVGTGWNLDFNLPLRDITPRNCRCSIKVTQRGFRPVGSRSRDLRLNRFGGGVIGQGRGVNVSMQFGFKPAAPASSTYELAVRGRCSCNVHGHVDRKIRVKARGEALDWLVHSTSPFEPKKNGDFYLRLLGGVPSGISHDFSTRTARCTLRWSTRAGASGIVWSMRPVMEFDARVERRRGRLRFSTNHSRVTVSGGRFEAKVPQQTPSYPPANANYLVLTVDEGNREVERSESNNTAAYRATFRGIEEIEGVLVKMGHGYAAQIQREWKAGAAFYALRRQPDLRLRPFVVPWSWLAKQPKVSAYVKSRFQRVSGLETRRGRLELEKKLRTRIRRSPGARRLSFGGGRRWRSVYGLQTQREDFGIWRLPPTFAERDTLLGSFSVYGEPKGVLTRARRGRWDFTYDGASVVAVDNFTFADERIKPGEGSFLGVWKTRFGRISIHDHDYLLWQRLVGRGEDRLVVTKPVWLPLLNRSGQRITRTFRFRG